MLFINLKANYDKLPGEDASFSIKFDSPELDFYKLSELTGGLHFLLNKLLLLRLKNKDERAYEEFVRNRIFRDIEESIDYPHYRFHSYLFSRHGSRGEPLNFPLIINISKIENGSIDISSEIQIISNIFASVSAGLILDFMRVLIYSIDAHRIKTNIKKSEINEFPMLVNDVRYIVESLSSQGSPWSLKYQNKKTGDKLEINTGEFKKEN